MTEPDARIAMPDKPVRLLLAVIGALCLASGAAGAASLEGPEVANEGYYQLRWEAGQPIRLVEASSAGFGDATTLYTGSDSAHVVSGKPDGTWYYRLEAEGGDEVLAGPIAVTVRHHSLVRAFGFFTLGAIVFFATLGLILLARPGGDERA